MTHPHSRGPRGFTIIETLTTIFIFTLIMLAASDLMRSLLTSPKQLFGSLDSIDQVRSASLYFSNEMRDAQAGGDGSYALNLASSSQIIFFSSYGSGGTTTVRRIRYFVASSSLYKGVVTPSGSPPTYNLATESVHPVVTNLKNASSSVPVFLYYDGTYAGTSSPLTQPVNLNQVKYVKMQLVVLTQTTRTSTSTYTVISGATIRSLKNNLGN